MTVRRRGRAVPTATQTKRRSCDGKDKFDTADKARRSVDRRVANGAREGSLRAYACKFCHQWHVGHVSGNQMKH